MDFPREVGPPRKIVYNKEEYLKFINKYNGLKTSIYSSIYHFEFTEPKVDYNSAIITCLFFDFDDKDCDAYGEVKKLHDYCFENNIMHRINMSGRGYHCYVITETYRTKNTRDTIYNGQHFFIDKLNLDLDTHVVGNPAQLSRVENTWNGRISRYCIPLTKEQFDKGDKAIKELSIKQNFLANKFICENKFKLNNYDYQTKMFDDDADIKAITIELENSNINFPPCLINIIKRGDMRWKERYLLILYLKELGYSQQNTYDILNTVCKKSTLSHCINEEKQLQYLYERDDLVFPSCNKISMDGYCSGKCDQYGKVIYK